MLFGLSFLVVLRADKRLRLLAWILTAQMAYSVYVGGDAWEDRGGANRYICIAMPGFFILLAEAVSVLASAMVNVGYGDHPPTAQRRRSSGWIFTLCLLYAWVSTNSIYGVSALAEALLIRPPLHSGNGGENHQEVAEALLLRDATRSDATVAVVRAGTILYFADRYSIDILGKSDRQIAREPVTMSSGRGRFVEFRPGHMKFDYAYSIGRLRPDVIAQLWSPVATAKPFLLDNYEGVLLEGNCVYALRGSPRVRWDRLTPSRCDR